MKYQLFQESTVENQRHNPQTEDNVAKLIEVQALALVTAYHTTCFSVKQLQTILGVGESNVYHLLRSGKLPSRTIGRRKVVPVSVLAEFLVSGEKNS